VIIIKSDNVQKHLTGYDIDGAFGTDQPRVLEFPHVIVRRHGQNPPAWVLNHFLANIAKQPGGIWGREPLVDRRGRRYVEDLEYSLDEFVAWEHPVNQWELFTHVSTGRDTERFTAVIAAATSIEVLRAMESRVSSEDGRQASAMEGMGDIIESLRWAYIPLFGECPWAMFLVARRDAPMIDELSTVLEAANEPSFQIRH
jgi:hypothetical protein